MIDIDGLQYNTLDQMENHHISNQHGKKESSSNTSNYNKPRVLLRRVF